MIFTSLGLLLVSLGLLLAGIAKSSVTLLMFSLLTTIVAGVVLAMVLPAARRLNAATATANGGPMMTTPNGQPVVLYVQQAPAPTNAVPVPPDIDLTAPIVGYDEMTAQQVNKLIASGVFTDDQLNAVREYERAHAGRRSVLAKLS